MYSLLNSTSQTGNFFSSPHFLLEDAAGISTLLTNKVGNEHDHFAKSGWWTRDACGHPTNAGKNAQFADLLLLRCVLERTSNGRDSNIT